MNIKKAIRRISAAFRPLAVFAGGLLFWHPARQRKR